MSKYSKGTLKKGCSDQKSYNVYIKGVSDRGTFPWKVAPTDGIRFGDLVKSWNQVKSDVNNHKRTYYIVDTDYDTAVWESYINQATDIWEKDEAQKTYGIQTTDQKVSWERFVYHVDMMMFVRTEKRNNYMDELNNYVRNMLKENTRAKPIKKELCKSQEQKNTIDYEFDDMFEDL